MVLENVVIMGCCNENLCSRSEYLEGGGRGGAERRKKGEQQRERPRGSGQGLFKPRYSLSQFLRVECVGNWSSSFFFPTILSQRNGFPLSLVTDGRDRHGLKLFFFKLLLLATNKNQ